MQKVKIILTRSNGTQSVREYDNSLTSLDLSSNSISEIEGLENLEKLTHLYLSYNFISKIEGLENLKKLTTLYLYNNFISKIEGLENLKNLTHFELSHNSISNPNVIYDDYCYLDGIFSRIKSKKNKDEFVVIKTVDNQWIVGKDGLYSHGKTLKEAKDDLIFKNLQKNFDVTKLVARIKESKVVTVNDYRLMTGACKRGIEGFKKEIGLKKNEMSLKDLKEKVKGRYGYERFMNLIDSTILPS